MSFSPAAERNKEPILAQLRHWLPARARVLEIASGSGQHAEHFALACPGWSWQPTEADAAALPFIDARCQALRNVHAALRLDVTETPWRVEPRRFDALYSANLLHIAPWPVCRALMQGAARCLESGGLLLIYGPFRVDGVPTAASNEAFDADLKARNPAWGLRLLSRVEHAAAAAGLTLRETVPMPANNLLVAFACPR